MESQASTVVVENLRHSHADVEGMLGKKFAVEHAWFLTLVERPKTAQYPLKLTCPFSGKSEFRYEESATQFLVSVAPRGHVLLDIPDRKRCPEMIRIHYQYIEALKPGERLAILTTDVAIESVDAQEPMSLRVGETEFQLGRDDVLIKSIAKATKTSFGIVRHEQLEVMLPRELDLMFGGNCLCLKPDLSIPMLAELVFQS